MSEFSITEEERGRPYKVIVCFLQPTEKLRFVEAAKMKKGRTLSRFAREGMELLMRVEEKLLKKIELLTYEYAENEFLDTQFRQGNEGSEEKKRSAYDQNPILAFIEAKSRHRSTRISRQ